MTIKIYMMDSFCLTRDTDMANRFIKMETNIKASGRMI